MTRDGSIEVWRSWRYEAVVSVVSVSLRIEATL